MMTRGHFFLSTRNSVRSIFAEAVTNQLGRGRFTGFSAGIEPAQALDPIALDILRQSPYPTEGLRPKTWTELAGADAPPLDFVFTLCDLKSGEPLPHWPGRPVTAHWRYPDPDKLNARGAAQGAKRHPGRLGAAAQGLHAAALAFTRPH